MGILQKWKVSIEADGKGIDEMKADNSDDDDSQLLTRYIEVKSTANFAIRITAPKASQLKGNAVLAEIFIDGVSYSKKLFDKYTRKRSSNVTVSRDKLIEGYELNPTDGSAKIRPFQFSLLRAHSFAATDLGEERLAKLGSIEVTLYHYKKVRWNSSKHGATQNTDDARPITAYSEAQLQNRYLSHVMRLGEERSHKRSKPWAGEILGDAFATFHFKYRSRRVLQDLGLIVRTPSPEPAGERPLEEWTLKQLRHFVRKVQTVAKFQSEMPAASGASLKSESLFEEDLKDEDEEEDIKSDIEDCTELKYELPDGANVVDLVSPTNAADRESSRGRKRERCHKAVVIDLVSNSPPPKRGRGRPRKNAVPKSAEVIVIDGEDETLFL